MHTEGVGVGGNWTPTPHPPGWNYRGRVQEVLGRFPRGESHRLRGGRGHIGLNFYLPVFWKNFWEDPVFISPSPPLFFVSSKTPWNIFYNIMDPLPTIFVKKHVTPSPWIFNLCGSVIISMGFTGMQCEDEFAGFFLSKKNCCKLRSWGYFSDLLLHEYLEFLILLKMYY